MRHLTTEEKNQEYHRQVVHSENFSLYGGDYTLYNSILDRTLSSYKAKEITAEEVNKVLLGIAEATTQIPDYQPLNALKKAFYSKAQVFSLYSGEFSHYNQELDLLLFSYREEKSATESDVDHLLTWMADATQGVPDQPTYEEVRKAFYAQAANKPNPEYSDLPSLSQAITTTLSSFSKIDTTIKWRLPDVYQSYQAASQEEEEAAKKLLVARYYYALYNYNKKSDVQFLTSLLGFIGGKNSLPALDDTSSTLNKTFAKIPRLIKLIDVHYEYLLQHDAQNLNALLEKQSKIQNLAQASSSEERSPAIILQEKIDAASAAKTTLTQIGSNPTTKEKLFAIQQHTQLMTTYSTDEKYSHLHRDPKWQRWLITGMCIAIPVFVACRMIYCKAVYGTVKFWRPHQRNLVTQLRRDGENTIHKIPHVAQEVILAF